MTIALTRRNLLAAALAAGVVLPGAGPAAAAASTRPRLTLPPPTGPHRVGTVALHLVGGGRELMASVWYPAAHDHRRPVLSPWLLDRPWRALLATIDLDGGAVGAPLTAGREGAPVLRSLGPRPVVFFSHGGDGHRSETTIVVQELVSHGYVVVTVDHADAYTEFPGGRLAVPGEESVTPWDHAHDVRFVLDRLEHLAAGRNPDAGRGGLPAGLGAALDLRRVGMFGWSKGATATALVMNEDRRVRAGLSFDGPMESQPRATDLDRPFMLMTAEFGRTPGSPVEEFWSRLHGWRLTVRAEGGLHGAYCDHQWFMPQLARVVGWGDEELAGWIGMLDPAAAVRIQQAYPLAFFDLHLRRRGGRLLDGPSAAFPEVRFVR